MKIVLNSGKELWSENYSKIEFSHKFDNKVVRETYTTKDDSLVTSLITHQIIYCTGLQLGFMMKNLISKAF